MFTGAAFGLFIVATLGGRVVDNNTSLVSIVVSLLVNIYLALSSNGLLPAAYTAAVDSYWTNVFVNAIFLCTAVLVGSARCLCCPRRRGSRYGEFKLVNATGHDDSEDSGDEIQLGGRRHYHA